jgi:hypothetical protein
MPGRIAYRVLKMGLMIGTGLVLGAGSTPAQQPVPPLTEWDVYCSGLPSTQAPPGDSYIISGENANDMITYFKGQEVFINRGAAQGVQVGSEFEVIRPVQDPLKSKWFTWQPQLLRAMGTMYADIGRVRVVSVQPKISIAEVELSCDMIQRGDIVRPFAARPVPAFHDVKFDPLTAPTGRGRAMVVTGKGYTNAVSAGDIVYVNLGSAQGVQTGNYFRMFRYQGARNETVYQVPRMAYQVYGLGSTPVPYDWNTLPREVVGEGIVLRTGPNSSTVMVTTAREAVMSGDYVEIE